MNSFAEIFDATTAFLRTKRIEPDVYAGSKAQSGALEKFRCQTGAALPESFSSFHTGFADGFEFRWEKNERGGVFVMPALDQLSEMHHSWQRNADDFLGEPSSLDKCVKPGFRAAAFEIWRSMKLWLPFYAEGGGDHFCLEISSGRIVYDQHDWFDGFGSIAKSNGTLAGETLLDFIANWSRFCFLPNQRLWWGEFGKFGAIQWKPEYFDSNYCQLGLVKGTKLKR